MSIRLPTSWTEAPRRALLCDFSGLAIPFLFCFLAAPLSAAPLRLPTFYGSGMVLPCDSAFVIEGEAAPGQEVSAKIGPQPEMRTRSGPNGRWRISVLPTPPSAQRFDLTIRSSHDTVVCTNVLFGDLWICAGQSNMAFPLGSCDTAAAAAAAATDPHLRLLNIACRLPTGNQPWTDDVLALSKSSDALRSSWCAVTPQTAPSLSAVGVLFGQALRRARPGVPVGLIQIAVGGAPAESFVPAADGARRAWLDDPAFPAPWCQARAKANLAHALGRPGFEAIHHPYEPGFLFTRAVEPLTALPVTGVLWYQGESNATTCGTPDAALDGETMYQGIVSLVRQWRLAWSRDDLPFVMVQLPRMNRPWMLFREQQLRAAQALPHVGLAVTTDTGNPSNVHPADKARVAERAACEALRVAYRDPKAPSVTFAVSATGDSPVLVAFTSGHTLAAKGGALTGFELSSDGAAFVPASAALRADNTVALSVNGLSAPAAVRYNWSPVPPGNLYNAAGVPVPPFRLTLQRNVH